MFVVSGLDGLLIAGQALGVAQAVSGLWRGQGLKAQLLWIALFLGCLLVRQAIDYGRSHHLDKFSRRHARSLQEQLLASIYDQGTQAISRHGSASIATSLIEGIDQVRIYLTLHLSRTADLIAIPCVLAVILLFLDPISGIIAVVIIPCIFFYMRLLGTMAKESASAKLGTFQRMANHFTDTLRGMQTIKAFGRGAAVADSIFSTSEAFRHVTLRTIRTATLSSLVLDLFRVFALAAIAIMLGFRLMAGNIQLMPALCVLVIVPELFAAVRRYSTDFHATLDGKKQLQAILDLLAEGTENNPKASPSEAMDADEALDEALNEALSLKLENLSFSYENGHMALQSIDLDIAAPAKVGIVGASGAGKSTLAQLLAGFASPSDGTIMVGEQQAQSLDADFWRCRTTYIPQHPHIFQDTLGNNIAFYRPDASSKEILQAAHKAGLDSLIATLPQGLDTPIGEAGRGLSGGQAQRIALARAFLCKDRNIVVFDEPTAHLDIETELALKEHMLSLMEGRLVFFATHRLHWMRNMDLILVLDQGCLVQAGSFEDLSSLPGPFLELVDSLQGGELL